MLRAQVAACTLLLNNLKIMGYSGHVSARLPGRDAYLIQGFDQPRSGLRPEHLLICDYDGKMLSGPPASVRRQKSSCMVKSCAPAPTLIPSRISITTSPMSSRSSTA